MDVLFPMLWDDSVKSTLLIILILFFNNADKLAELLKAIVAIVDLLKK